MATKQIAWTTGSGYITLTYNGLGNGTITVSSDDNTGVAREQIITIETTAGTPVVTKNITIRQEAYVPPILNFSYTGTVQSCTLPPGTYRLQCWGAQGGSNATDSTYGITAQAGGKGGYSEGILTLDEVTTLYVFVGGQGSSSGNGGWNGGGGTRGSSSHTDSDYYLKSAYACGGGATDIALTTSTMSYSSYRTNRSSASYLSRFIVAGGGSGGAMAYKEITTSTTSWETVGTLVIGGGTFNGHTYTTSQFISSGKYYTRFNFAAGDIFSGGDKLRITLNDTFDYTQVCWVTGSSTSYIVRDATSSPITFDYTTCPSSSSSFRIQVRNPTAHYSGTILVEKQVTTITTTTENIGRNGYAGGGTEAEGYNATYIPTQNSGYAFGYGANNYSATVYGLCSGGGGAGWYGGTSSQSNSSTSTSVLAGYGGSGFVNIAANAQYRPTGYTGIELDSGATYAGNTSFPSTSGSTETGHEGNGYARITCIDQNSLIPLTFDILESGTIGWKAQNSSLTKTIQYSKNGGSWTSITSTTSGVTFSVSAGDVVQFRGDNTAYGNASYYNRFTATCQFKVRGNIMSLINSTSFSSLTTLTETGALRTLFYQNTYLIDASELLLPATTLSTRCYQGLFNGCTNLTAVPVLPAATLASNAYNNLFNACSSLTYIKCLATNISASNCTSNWVNGVAATGTFVKASTMSSWTTGNAGIPSGWTVQDA